MFSTLADRLSRWFGPKNSRRRKSVAWASEGLEQRALLATLVGANKVTYQDFDGDNVTVTLSKPILTSANVNSIFTFNSGSVNNSNAGKQVLFSINLAGLTSAAGTTITTASARSPKTGGDGYASLGEINASGIDLGAIVMDGDLGQIHAGDTTLTTTGVASVKAHSIGRFGQLTGASTLTSSIQGKLGSLTTKSDVKEASIVVNGAIGPITIGGSLIGGEADSSGKISGTEFGAVIIKGDIVGNDGIDSGILNASQKIASVKIGGSLIGGKGLQSGGVYSSLGIGTLTIAGSIRGGAGSISGRVITSFGGKVTSMVIGGSVIGSSGHGSGQVFVGVLGTSTISGNIIGGSGSVSGMFSVNGRADSIVVGGSIIGGSNYAAGIVSTVEVGTIKVQGSLIGGSADKAGRIGNSKTASNITIGGDVKGGTGDNTGTIASSDSLAVLSIGGSLVGGSSGIGGSGSVFSNGRIGTMTIGGSLSSGSGGPDNGAVRAFEIGSITIKGDLVGTSTNAAAISTTGQIKPTATSDLAIGSITINGRVENAIIFYAGSTINADAQISAVTVGGDWIACSLIAGVDPGLDGKFGTGDDHKLAGSSVKDVATVLSSIKSITIGGQVIGTTNGLKRDGFVAESIGILKVGDTLFPLQAGKSNDSFFVGILFNQALLEV